MLQIEELQRLAQLKAGGTISEAEFVKLKAELLQNEPHTMQPPTISTVEPADTEVAEEQNAAELPPVLQKVVWAVFPLLCYASFAADGQGEQLLVMGLVTLYLTALGLDIVFTKSSKLKKPFRRIGLRTFVPIFVVCAIMMWHALRGDQDATRAVSSSTSLSDCARSCRAYNNETPGHEWVGPYADGSGYRAYQQCLTDLAKIKSYDSKKCTDVALAACARACEDGR
jgi:hypothetical protein